MNDTSSLPHVTTSWWLRDALQHEAPTRACPALTGQTRADVVVVGGGFAGMWTALTLRERRPDLSITLIEAQICGAGASGKNGGMVSGYWSRLSKMESLFGYDQALAVARAASRAQDIVRAYATSQAQDLWWRESGTLIMATQAAHSERIDAWLATARRFGVPEIVEAIEKPALGGLCDSPFAQRAAFFHGSACVHPARLARSLRATLLERGVTIHEHTPMVGLDRGTPQRVRCPNGEIIADDVVLATNVALTDIPEVRRHLALFSSYVAMSEPDCGMLEKVGWTQGHGVTDMRLFLRYARKTPDTRVLAGWGGGPIAPGKQYRRAGLTQSLPSAARAAQVLQDWFPQATPPGIAATWGGAIDVSVDRMPFFRQLPGTRTYYAGGFTGHGVNATCLAGQCMASLVLNQKDEWSSLALCTRALDTFPPEPFRYLGARAIRWGILTCEDALESSKHPPALARMLAAAPEKLGLRIGTR